VFVQTLFTAVVGHFVLLVEANSGSEGEKCFPIPLGASSPASCVKVTDTPATATNLLEIPSRKRGRTPASSDAPSSCGPRQTLLVTLFALGTAAPAVALALVTRRLGALKQAQQCAGAYYRGPFQRPIRFFTAVVAMDAVVLASEAVAIGVIVYVVSATRGEANLSVERQPSLLTVPNLEASPVRRPPPSQGLRSRGTAGSVGPGDQTQHRGSR
jgi:hypothetical protein